jgi:serine/threonine protein kinase/WD40 repeat protein
MNAEDIFHKALAQLPADRAAFVASACAGDEPLQRRVKALLYAHENPAGFLAMRPFIDAPTKDEPGSERLGSVIGPYKLIEELGEGGMGTVYMAQQTQPVKRLVALKVIKPGMDSKQVLARFEAERQALALMDHANIAKVLDAGATPGGLPYFVMELVKGIPITEFCDKSRLPVEQRLKLFCDVCRAIQHAHHKAIIHRDIKPSNVLVTLLDGVPVVKVIDFGVAKAMAQKLTEKTLFTSHGQMIGTPAYMSPEQAEMSRLEIDTRSDVYSLGVLLYEILTGATPLEAKRMRDLGYSEVQRLICEEDLPWPKERLLSLGDSAAIAAENRKLDVTGLSRLLTGDLGCIVMKALEKDRNRRYATPAEFVDDIERYLRRERVLARPPSVAYKLTTIARRTQASFSKWKSIVAVGALAGFTLLGLLLGYGAGRRGIGPADPNPVGVCESFDPNIPAEGRVIPMGGEVRAVAFSPDGRKFAAGITIKQRDDTAGVVVWDLPTGKKIHHLWPDRTVRCLLFSPENDFLVYGGPQESRDWNFEANKEFTRYHKDGSVVTGLAFSNIVKAFAVCSYMTGESNGISQWEHPGGSSMPGIHDPAQVEQILYSPQDGTLAAAHRDGTVQLWDPKKAIPVAGPPTQSADFPVTLAFAPDRSILAVAVGGQVRFWDRQQLPHKWLDMELHIRKNVNAIAYTSDGKYLAVACEGPDVMMWDVSSRKGLVHTFRGHRNAVRSLMFSPGDKLLATGSEDGVVRLWDVKAALGK